MNKPLNMPEAIEIWRKRLRYRSWHRGCKETDMLLGKFADQTLDTLNTKALRLYEALLEENDADIWDWLSGKTAPPERYAEMLNHILTASVS